MCSQNVPPHARYQQHVCANPRRPLQPFPPSQPVHAWTLDPAVQRWAAFDEQLHSQVHSDHKVANHDIRVWHGAIENGP